MTSVDLQRENIALQISIAFYDEMTVLVDEGRAVGTPSVKHGLWHGLPWCLWNGGMDRSLRKLSRGQVLHPGGNGPIPGLQARDCLAAASQERARGLEATEPSTG